MKGAAVTDPKSTAPGAGGPVESDGAAKHQQGENIELIINKSAYR